MTKLSEETQALAQEIAEKLGETEQKPLEQIQLIIDLVGADFAKQKLDKALEIEQQGGLMVHRGARKRTLGGIYFYIIKGELEEDVRDKVFPNFGKTMIKRVLQWHERVEELAQFLQQEGIDGKLHKNPRVVLQGRPGIVKQIENTMIVVMEHEHTQAPYPKGVPPIPETSHMRYILYVGYRQWQKIEIAIKNPKDYFIAEGYQLWDAELNAMAIFVHHLTTYELERIARREKQASESTQDGSIAEQDVSKGHDKKPKGKKSDKKSAQSPPSRKNFAQNEGRKKTPPSRHRAPEPPPIFDVQIDIPAGMPSDIASKFQQLHNAAETFRERIATMEEKGQAGVEMTKRLLANTEKQIEEISQKYAE
jgi:hypothetical protein